MPAALDEMHGGDVGLAAKAAATRGSRPYGLSPPLRGDRGPHGLSPHTLNNSDENNLSLVSPVVALLLVAADCSRNKVENTKPNHDVSPAT